MSSRAPRVLLPLRFDPDRLRDDLASIADTEWLPHFNQRDHDGEWTGVALRSVAGQPDLLYPDPTATDRYEATPILARHEYLQEVLAAFACPLTSVRLLKLGAGASIREHRDHRLGHQHGEVRIHVPIVTNDDVHFYLDGERVHMAPGEAWYLDLELPHSVQNASDVDRVHLVIDCIVDDWLDALLAAGAPDEVTDVAASTVFDDPRAFVALDRALDGVFDDPLTARIVRFVREIGLPVARGAVSEGSVLPGLRIEAGTLVIDESALVYPGDVLHEAGHLAVMEPECRSTVTGASGSDPAEEMMAIAWSYAAALHLGIDPAVVFHEGGYRGGSTALLENFADGRYIGVPMLQWLGLAEAGPTSHEHAGTGYPTMRSWVRTSDQSSPEID